MRRREAAKAPNSSPGEGNSWGTLTSASLAPHTPSTFPDQGDKLEPSNSPSAWIEETSCQQCVFARFLLFEADNQAGRLS